MSYKQENKNNNTRPYSQASKPVKRLDLGKTVFAHVNHPVLRKNIYLCEARIVRVPSNRSDERYKIVVTGVQTSAKPKESDSFLSEILGMKIIRTATSLILEDPSSKYNIQGYWLKTRSPDQLFRTAVNNIRREPTRQMKRNQIPKL